MSSFTIKNVRLFSPGSTFHDQIIDVEIKNGLITDMGKDLQMSDDADHELVDGKGQVLAPGFFDLNANFGEPGLEHKEDLESGARAAMAGGFTGVAIHPNTEPPLARHAEVAFIVNRSKPLPVDIHPIGALSKKREGEELAELFDMQRAGAVAFSDGDRSVSKAGLMSKALLYCRGIKGLVISFPEDVTLSDGAQMNEGEMSTFLGMKGKPNLSESLVVERDLKLAEYHQAPLHFTTISTRESVNLIRQAKSQGIKVTADVAAHQLLLTDVHLRGFDSNYKVNPPLRTKRDSEALLEGLADGTLDAVVSQHTPHEIEFKNVEFQIAQNGIIGLQTVFSLLVEAGLSVEQIVSTLAINPRKILGLEVPRIDKGEKANLVLFDMEKTWEFTPENNFSKSSNSPYIGKKLTGIVTLTSNNGQTYRNEYYG